MLQYCSQYPPHFPDVFASIKALLKAILGISAFYHDSAAALVVDGDIVAAA
jgi:hypothetical protein